MWFSIRDHLKVVMTKQPKVELVVDITNDARRA
jgi:hypothetical protein